MVDIQLHAHGAEIMAEKMTDRQKVTAWLASIGAPKDEADEVLELCAKDKDARAYYLGLS